MLKDAIPEYKKAWVLLKKESDVSAEGKARDLTRALETGGAPGYWQKRLEFSQEDYAKGTGKAYTIAVCFARIGDENSTFEQLENSLAARELDLIWIRTESAFDAMSDDPRFADLLRRIGVE